MPVVTLPLHLIEDLEKNETGKIEATEGPGVASYLSADEDTRADIYIGLELDGFLLYQNLSSVNADIRMTFSPQPVVICPSDVIIFVPGTDSTIAIQVRLF